MSTPTSGNFYPSAHLAGFASGSPEVFTELVEHHSSWLRGIVWSFLPDSDDVDDVLQTVWSSAYFNRHSFAGRGEVRDWLRSIARRACLMELRRRRRLQRRRHLLAEFHESTSHTSPPRLCPAGRAEVRESVRAALRSLTDRERAVVRSRLLEQLTTPQTAARLAGTESGVKSALFRGKRKLRAELQDLRSA